MTQDRDGSEKSTNVTNISAGRRRKKSSEPKDSAAATGEKRGAGDGDGERKGPSQATTLLQLARENYRPLMGEDGQPYAVRRGGANIALPLRGNGGLRNQLAKLFADRCHGTVPSSSALTDALTVFAGIAENCEAEPIHLRVAPFGDGIVLDLGTADGRCVVVTPHEWRPESQSPVLFRRTRLSAALPDPYRRGDLGRLRPLINVDEESWRLIVGWMVAAWMPDIPHAILGLFGLQGTAKTNTSRMIVGIISPSAAPTRSAPKDIKTWVTSANAAWVTGLDNLSTIPDWLSDALCRASTGEGMVDRALYTDLDVSVVAFRRVVVINGIDVGTMAGDLTERLVRIDLDPITRRRDERELWREYEGVQPYALGGLLDLLSKVLAALPNAKVEDPPRMADFAHVLAAVDEVMDWKTLATYRDLSNDAQGDALSPFGTMLRDFVQERGGWRGTPTRLLGELVPTDKDGKPRPPKDWPNERTVRGRIKRDMPALKTFGVEVEFERDSDRNRTRVYKLTAARVDGATNTTASDTYADSSSMSSATSEAHGNAMSDGLFGADDVDTMSSARSSASSATSSDAPIVRTTRTTPNGTSSATSSAEKPTSGPMPDDADDADDESAHVSDVVGRGWPPHETGNCTRCREPCHRYGAGGAPLCVACRQASSTAAAT